MNSANTLWLWQSCHPALLERMHLGRVVFRANISAIGCLLLGLAIPLEYGVYFNSSLLDKALFLLVY
jgi:hypothetical protein